MRDDIKDWRKVPVPLRMHHLDKDRRGLPIPFLVIRDADGGAHFTMNDETKRQRCLKEDRCAICGHGLFRFKWYVGGPLSAFHEHGSYIDTPLHAECMTYALQVCPYLAAPRYTKEIAGATLDREKHPGLVTWEYPEPDRKRPPIFVGVMSTGHKLVKVNLLQSYVKPIRPYRAVQYWRHGERVPEAEGRAIVAQLMAQADNKEA